MTAGLSIDAIIQRADPALRIDKQWVLGGGQSSDMVAVEGTDGDGATKCLVVRAPRVGAFSTNPDRIAHEYRALELLADAGVAAPRPVYLDDEQPEGDAARFMVTSFVEGAPGLLPDDPAAFAKALAGMLAEIHAVKADGAGLRDHGGVVQGYFNFPAEGLDPSLDAGRMIDTLRGAWPPPTARQVLLHGDYWPGNVLWRDGAISAVVDWESTGTGDPLADVAVMRLTLLWMFDEDVMEGFTAAYEALAGSGLAWLAHWDLVAALRPVLNFPDWAKGWPACGRPDITEATMRADHQAFREAALAKLDG